MKGRGSVTSAIVVIPEDRYGGTVQFESGMSEDCAKRVRDRRPVARTEARSRIHHLQKKRGVCANAMACPTSGKARTEEASSVSRRPVPFVFRKLLRRRRGIRLGLPEEPLVLRTERGRSGARDEHFGHAPRTTGRHEEPGVRVDIGGHDVRRHGKTFREELRGKRS